jgi:hypothetical protein
MPSPLQQFTRDLLHHAGALVDDAGEGALDVIVGDALGADLGLAGYERLVFHPELEAGGARLVSYESPVVDRMETLVSRLGRVAVLRPPAAALKAPDAESALARGLTLQNGVYRVRRVETAEATYVGVLFEYNALADERSGGLTTAWVNADARSAPTFATWPAWLQTPGPDPAEADTEEVGGVEVPWPMAIAKAREAVVTSLGDFLASLARRRDRDAARLREYYGTIDEEIRRKLARPRITPEARRREMDRLEATARTYRARVGDLGDRYRVRVRLTPAAVMLCRLAIARITVRLMRRTASADATFVWNPIDARLERRACDGCLVPTASAWLCDERVHYLCERCLSPCDGCGRAYCRACHSRCPRGHA